MSRILKKIVIGIGCFAIGSTVSAKITAQNTLRPMNGNSQVLVNQTLNEIADLPASSDIANTRAGFSLANPKSSASAQPHSTFYRQFQTQDPVYGYPAVGPPRVAGRFQSNPAIARNNTGANLTNQLSYGSSPSTGLLGRPLQTNNQAPNYSVNPYALRIAQSTRNASSRSPVEQQRSSTVSQRQPEIMQFTSAQQAQSQATQLARQAEAQQAQARLTLAQAQQAQARAAQLTQASQPTTVYRQSVYQQPTLGLGGSQFRTVQYPYPGAANPSTPVPPGNQPAGSVTGQVCCKPNYQLQPMTGVPAVPTLQNLPIGTYYGRGIIGQSKAYVDGQPVRNLFRYITP